MVRLTYEILDGKVGLADGCSRIWELADEHGLILSPSIERFIQFDLDYEGYTAGASGSELSRRRASFEAARRDEICTELGLLLLRLQEPVYTLQYVAKGFLEGQLNPQEAVLAMHGPICALALQDREPYATLKSFALDFHDTAGSALWDPDLLKRKEKENIEMRNWIFQKVKDGCTVIVEHPIKHPF